MSNPLDTAWDRLNGTEWPARVGALWGRYGSRFASAWDDLEHHDQVSVYRIIMELHRNRKPRTITTAEELGTLGNGAIIKTLVRDQPIGRTWGKIEGQWWGLALEWGVDEPVLPAAVIHEREDQS